MCPDPSLPMPPSLKPLSFLISRDMGGIINKSSGSGRTKSTRCQSVLGGVDSESFEGGDEVLFIFKRVPRGAMHMLVLTVSSDRGDSNKDGHQNSMQCFLGSGSPQSSFLLGPQCVWPTMDREVPHLAAMPRVEVPSPASGLT